jgi:peptidoglycan/xylan/chitin deacetylase (PgdA/CDA1 family)
VSLLRVLVYHRIEDPAHPRTDINPDLASATAAEFERQVRHLTRYYHPVGADEVLAAVGRRHRLPSRAALVTFDDGYRDFLELAWPILERYQVPSILFVPTAYVEQPERIFWWDAVWQTLTRTTQVVGDPLIAFRAQVIRLKSLPPRQRSAEVSHLSERLGVRPEPPRAVLSWPELRHLVAAGVTVAAHTQIHERLDQLDRPTLMREVEGSRDDVVRELGSSPPVFAYPYGNVNGQVVKVVRQAGFECAFTTLCGLNAMRRAHPWLLRRDDPHVSFRRFAIKLTSPVAALRTLRHPWPR